MKSQRKVWLIVLAGIVLFSAIGCGGGGGSAAKKTDEITIGLTLMDYNFTFFQDMLAMAKKTAADNNVKLVDFDGAGNTTKQLTDCDDMIGALKVKALFLNPVDSDAIGPAVLDANDAGIPVITVDVRAAQGKVTAHVSSDNVEIGRMAARYAVEILKQRYGAEKGTVFVMGYPQISSIRGRAEGFVEVIKNYPDIKMIQSDPISLDVANAMKLMDDVLQANPSGSIDVVFGANETNANGILSSAESNDRKDFRVISVDDAENLLNALEDPENIFVATVVQSPTEMGRIGIEFCIKAARGETIDTPDVATAITLVTKDTIKQFRQDAKTLQDLIAPYKSRR
jgi:ribose transport system substrate-binding protein